LMRSSIRPSRFLSDNCCTIFSSYQLSDQQKKHHVNRRSNTTGRPRIQCRSILQDSNRSAATELFANPEKVASPPLSPAEIEKRVELCRQASLARELEEHIPTMDEIVSAKDPHEPPFVSNAARFNDETRFSERPRPLKTGSNSRQPRPSSLRESVERHPETPIVPIVDFARSRSASIRSLSITHTEARSTAQTSRLDLTHTQGPSPSKTGGTMSKLLGGMEGAVGHLRRSRGGTSSTARSGQGTGGWVQSIWGKSGRLGEAISRNASRS